MRRRWSLIPFVLACSWAVASAGEPGQARHLLVTLELEGSCLRVLEQRAVALPLPLDRDPGLAAAWPWRLVLRAADGELLHRAGLEDPTELRAAFADGGRTRGVRVRREGPVQLAVRVPLVAGRLALERLDPARPRSARPAEADFVEVAAVEVRP